MKYLILLFLLIGCTEDDKDDYRTRYLMNCSESVEGKEILSKFVLACIKNANPKSDEEPEDWIRLCQKMGKDIHCTKIRGFIHWTGNYWTDAVACSEAGTPLEKQVCGIK